MNIKERIFFKLFSGRFIFTIISAGVFAYLSVKGILHQDKVMEVLMVVIMAYFSKNRQPPNNGGEK